MKYKSVKLSKITINKNIISSYLTKYVLNPIVYIYNIVYKVYVRENSCKD